MLVVGCMCVGEGSTREKERGAQRDREVRRSVAFVVRCGDSERSVNARCMWSVVCDVYVCMWVRCGLWLLVL